MTPERRLLEDFMELVSKASPLAWVASQDMAGAQQWEKEALSLINRVPDLERREDNGN